MIKSLLLLRHAQASTKEQGEKDLDRSLNEAGVVDALRIGRYLLKEEISIERIGAQLSKELEINAKLNLLGQESGVNRNTLTDGDVKQFTEGYLTSRLANDIDDDLILSFENIVVNTVADSYNITYKYQPNTPINKLFFTGFAIIN